MAIAERSSMPRVPEAAHVGHSGKIETIRSGRGNESRSLSWCRTRSLVHYGNCLHDAHLNLRSALSGGSSLSDGKDSFAAALLFDSRLVSCAKKRSAAAEEKINSQTAASGAFSNS